MNVIPIKPLSRDALDSLRKLFFDGPTWDDDLASKEGRIELIKLGYANRLNGWNYLTLDGVDLCITSGLDHEKQKRRQ
jgi:hypothetical protein